MQDQPWRRLNAEQANHFQREHPATFDIIRTALPTNYSRNVVNDRGRDNSVMPSELWARGDDEYAFVWRVRNTADSNEGKRIAAFFSITPDARVERINTQPDGVPSELTCEQVDFSRQFWTCEWGNPKAQQAHGQEQALSATAATPKRTRAAYVARIKQAEDELEAVLRRELASQAGAADGAAPAGSELVQPDVPAECINWQPLTEAHEIEAVATRLVAAGVSNFTMEAPVDRRRYLVLKRATPFYPGFCLYRIIDLRGRRSRFTSCVLSAPDNDAEDACLLGTDSPPIHQFNQTRMAAHGLIIDDQTVVPYLRFFCEFVHGGQGAFPIIGRADEIKWLSELQTQAADDSPDEPGAPEAAFLSAIRPVLVLCEPHALQGAADAAFLCRAFVGYGRVIFLAGFKVGRDGHVTMLDDRRPHDGELPIEPLSFNREFQFELIADVKKVAAKTGLA